MAKKKKEVVAKTTKKTVKESKELADALDTQKGSDFDIEKPKAKTLGNTDTNTTRSNVKDVVIWGGDKFKLIQKASSEAEGWMKSTKAMKVTGGVVLQVTTQQRNPDGSYAVAEAVTFIPGLTIKERRNKEGKVIDRVLF